MKRRWIIGLYRFFMAADSVSLLLWHACRDESAAWKRYKNQNTMQHKRSNKQADAPPSIRPPSLMFHWGRFVGMARTRCANEWRRWLLFLLGGALLYVLLLALCFFFSTRPVLDFRGQASFLYMTLPLAGPAFAWLYGAAWRKPHGLQRMRPVSALEHCLLGVLIVLVIYPLVHLLVLTLIHWPASKIDYLRSLAYWQGLDEDAR